MRIPIFTVLSTLAVFTLARPAPAADKSAPPVLTKQPYSQFSVSSGVGGNALAEIFSKFPIDQNNLAAVAPSDLAIITEAARVAEQAEVGTNGFNEAIKAAGNNMAVVKPLQVGKIKNKVLKLQTDVWRIQIEVAQGNNHSESNLQEQQTKLDKNVALDKKSAGQPSMPVNFVGTD